MLSSKFYVELYVVVALVVVFAALYALFWDPLRSIPGPLSCRFTKIFVTHKIFKGESHVIYRDLHKKYGSVVRIGPNQVLINDPSAIPKLYAVDSNFIKVRRSELHYCYPS